MLDVPTTIDKVTCTNKICKKSELSEISVVNFIYHTNDDNINGENLKDFIKKILENEQTICQHNNSEGGYDPVSVLKLYLLIYFKCI